MCQSLLFNKVACNFIKKETLSQVFFCQLCEVFKNKFFIEHFRWLLLEVVTKDINKLKHFKEEINTVERLEKTCIQYNNSSNVKGCYEKFCKSN